MGYRRRGLRPRPQVPILAGTVTTRRRVHHRPRRPPCRPSPRADLETTIGRRRSQRTTPVQLGHSHRPTIGEPTPDGWVRRLLVRRQITPSDVEPALAYYLCCAPATTTDEELIRVAGARWAIEECFQTAKPRSVWTTTKSPLRRLAPTHQPRHARPHLPRRHHRDHAKALTTT